MVVFSVTVGCWVWVKRGVGLLEGRHYAFFSTVVFDVLSYEGGYAVDYLYFLVFYAFFGEFFCCVVRDDEESVS